MKKNEKKHSYKGEISILLSVVATSIALAFSEDISMAIHTNNITTSIFQMDKGEEIANIIEKTLNENEAFQEELASSSEFPNDYFVSSLSSYFEKYGEYYSTEQIKRFKIGLEMMERYDKEETYKNLLYYAITGEKTVTNIFASAYADSIIYNYCREKTSYTGLNKNFEKLVAYLPSEEVASYIIRNDIEGLKQALKDCYYLESTEKLETLEYLYKELALAKSNKNEKRIKVLNEEIKRRENFLLASKLENDAAFKETFCGQIALQNVNGQEDSFYYVYSETEKRNQSSITGEYYHNLTVDDISLESKTTYQTAIHRQAIKDLSKKGSLFFDRLSFLLDSEDFSPYPNMIISNLINKYPNHFQSIEEAEEFIVALYDNNQETVDKYLQMLEHKWKNAPISMELVAEVKAFEEYVYNCIRFDSFDNITGEFDHNHIYSYEKESELTMIAKEDEEAQHYEVCMMEFTYPWEAGTGENTLFTFINNMKDYLNEKGENFSYVATNPYTNRDVNTLERELAPSNEIYVYSKALGPQIVCKDGIYITFVSIPPNYEEGTLCYQTENIFGQEMKKEIPFLISENEDGLIAIISVSEESPSIPSRFINYYFKTTYDHINKEGKMVFKLTNEEN